MQKRRGKMYKVYLGDILLPIPPSKIELKYGNKNKTTTLINGTEINVIKPLGLSEFSFNAVLPNVRYPFANYEGGEFIDAGVLYERIRNLKLNQTPFYFRILRTLPNGTILFYNDEFKATIEDLAVMDDTSQGFDITVKIKLKQYRDYGTKTLTLEEAGIASVVEERSISEEKKEEIPSETNPKSYTVQKGDSLWTICKKFYGDGSKYKDVAAKNNIANPNFLSVGQVLVLD